MKPIFVTEPHLPALDKFIPMLEDIWKSKWITNMGEYHLELEKALAEYLGVPYISLFTNGTIALITALQTLDITGEVITTPFSFAATCHALHWNRIQPIFVDIEPHYFNINPDLIEMAITPDTKAILPVHVYGHPCDNEKLQGIADRHGLKLMYDAAHAFGVKEKGTSVLNYGDLSILSFHATKVYNTIEGGAIVSHDKKTKTRVDDLKNFGITDELTIVAPGINGKMNELQAAYGLLQLKEVDNLIAKRKNIAAIYKSELKGIEGIRVMDIPSEIEYNYSYFPVLIDEKKYGYSRDYVYDFLKSKNIFSRKYFYPLLSNIITYNKIKSASKENLKVANRVADEVLCLPIFPDMSDEELKYILFNFKKISQA